MKEVARQSGLNKKSNLDEKGISGVSEKLYTPHGKRGDFVKLSITLRPEQYEKIVMESARRKVDRRKDNRLSDVIRDAVDAYFSESTL